MKNKIDCECLTKDKLFIMLLAMPCTVMAHGLDSPGPGVYFIISVLLICIGMAEIFIWKRTSWKHALVFLACQPLLLMFFLFGPFFLGLFFTPPTNAIGLYMRCTLVSYILGQIGLVYYLLKKK